jgi:hypothetical protein
MSIVGETIVARFTSLGDASQYHAGNFAFIDLAFEVSVGQIFDVGRVYSTIITRGVGKLFSTLFGGNAILIDMGFQAIAFVGIYMLLKSVEGRNRKILALLVLTPSFNLWSSVASKEALLVFFVGVLSAFFVKLYENRAKIGILEIVSVVGVFIFKVHYMPALTAIFFYIAAGRYVRQKVAFVVVTGMASLCLLYLVRDKIDRMAFSITHHFVGYGSSRDAYWIEKYDVFYKAPYGMLQGFFGPTLAESANGIVQMASFVESTIIMAMLLFLLLRNIPNMPLFSFVMGTFTLGWLLFGSYPLGILNGGSAVRYRTGHLLLVFFIFAIIFSREHYIRWQRGREGETTERRAAADSAAEDAVENANVMRTV